MSLIISPRTSRGVDHCMLILASGILLAKQLNMKIYHAWFPKNISLDKNFGASVIAGLGFADLFIGGDDVLPPASLELFPRFDVCFSDDITSTSAACQMWRLNRENLVVPSPVSAIPSMVFALKEDMKVFIDSGIPLRLGEHFGGCKTDLEYSISISRIIQSVFKPDSVEPISETATHLSKSNLLFNKFLMQKTIKRFDDSRRRSIRLFTPFYLEKNEERWKELSKCLKFNLESSIDFVYLLAESGEIEALKNKLPSSIIENSKLIWIDVPSRQTFKMAFDAVNRNLANATDISIIANTDIFFRNDSLERLRTKYDIGDERAICLSRWNTDENGENEIIFNIQTWSQDAWIFEGKIRSWCDSDFCFGKPCCDHRIANNLYYQSGYELINPVNFIKALHLHTVEIRNYHPEKDIVSGPRIGVIPILDDYKYVYI